VELRETLAVELGFLAARQQLRDSGDPFLGQGQSLF
jgi:hypothetical protein